MKLSKSKLALAKVINDNGVWPQDSAWAVQNGDHGRISFSVNKPVRHDSKSWMAKGGFNFKIEVCNPLKNWHQNVLSREEYYQAYPKADADGWIEWCGGIKSPVGDGVLVDVKLRSGRSYEAKLLYDASWSATWGDASIIAYRLHEQAKPEFCESVMRSIPEPESIDGLCAKVTEENKHQHVDAKPTIEQLAQDYRNAKDYAYRKQQEADAAKADADERLKVLEIAGEAIGLIVSPIASKQEPELSITDWRDLQAGDVISVSGKWWELDSEYTVDENDGSRDAPISVGGYWAFIDECSFKFIRRP